jgi:hypothetical protein
MKKQGEIKMNVIKLKRILGTVIMLGVVALGHASVTLAFAASDDLPTFPQLPAGCEQLAVPEGSILAYHVYAIGVQIYRWNGSAWAFVGPDATLYAASNYRGQVGSHYVGPTWESNSGSVVVGSSPVPCTPDPTAIPWLKLTAASSSGPGIFEGVTFIQRINTVGGLRPTTPGTTAGEEARVPYTTEYYFYK